MLTLYDRHRAALSGSGKNAFNHKVGVIRSWADQRSGAMSESDFEVASTIGHGPGESTLFLPGDTVFWLPYALSKFFCSH